MARRKKRIAVIDAETDPFKSGRDPKPFCWGFFDGEHYEQFWGAGDTREEQYRSCTSQLMDYLTDEKDLIIYAHNGGKFDFFHLIEYMDPELLLIGGRIAKCTLFDGAIELRDSWLIIPLPLSAYAKDEISYDLFELELRQQNKNAILRYLCSDCRYLYEWVMKFIDNFGLNLTVAGAAIKQLKATGYELEPTYEKFDSLFRHFYFGGRVQCFQVGSFYGDFEYVDINSAYSDAMMRDHWYAPNFIEGTRLPEKENGSWFASVKAVSRGALPYRVDGKLYFPDDKEQRVYLASGWEINQGLETGTLKIDKVLSVYEPLFIESFEPYVKKFFALKEQGVVNNDKTLKDFGKLLLNCPYGKMGQDGRKFEKYSLQSFGEWPKGEGWVPEDTFIDNYQLFSCPSPSYRFYNVATAASITGFVRAKVWGAIKSSDFPMCCETDSLLCRKFRGEKGKALGQWDVEARVREAHIAQRKLYAMRLHNYSDYGPINETKVASKGVRLTFDEIKEGVITRGEINYAKDAPAYSLKFGPRYFDKTISFKNLEKNALTYPPKVA